MPSDSDPDWLHFPVRRLGPSHVSLEIVFDKIEHRCAQELCLYWESRKSKDGALRRSDIRPRDIVHLLPWLFMAEPAGDEWRYRLFGTGLRDRLHIEFTGKTTGEIFEPATAEIVNGIYRSVSETGKPAFLRGRFLGLGLEFAAAEGVNLPMVNNDGSPMILGGVFFAGVFSHEFLVNRSL